MDQDRGRYEPVPLALRSTGELLDNLRPSTPQRSPRRGSGSPLSRTAIGTNDGNAPNHTTGLESSTDDLQAHHSRRLFQAGNLLLPIPDYELILTPMNSFENSFDVAWYGS